SRLDSRQQIEQRGIDRLYFVGAEIAQEVVDAIELAGNVAAIFPVSRGQAFAGVKSVELERAAPKLDGRARHRDRRHNQLCSGNRANSQKSTPRYFHESPERGPDSSLDCRQSITASQGRANHRERRPTSSLS